MRAITAARVSGGLGRTDREPFKRTRLGRETVWSRSLPIHSLGQSGSARILLLQNSAYSEARLAVRSVAPSTTLEEPNETLDQY
jgi:hypothetical protein